MVFGETGNLENLANNHTGSQANQPNPQSNVVILVEGEFFHRCNDTTRADQIRQIPTFLPLAEIWD